MSHPYGREAIFEACENALTNGNIEILNWTPAELAVDLWTYCYEASNMAVSDVEAICKEWLDAKNSGRTTSVVHDDIQSYGSSDGAKTHH